MLFRQYIHRPKNIIRFPCGASTPSIYACQPGIVNFQNHCSSCLRINLIFQVIRFVRSQFDCTQCICFSRRFYLRTEFFIYDSRFCRIYPMQKHLSLHWHYPHTAPRLQTKHCPAYKDSVFGTVFPPCSGKKSNGYSAYSTQENGRSHLLHIASRLRNSLEHAIHPVLICFLSFPDSGAAWRHDIHRCSYANKKSYFH